MDTSNFTNHYYFWPNHCNETSNECSELPGYYLQVFFKSMDESLLNQIEGIVEYSGVPKGGGVTQNPP